MIFGKKVKVSNQFQEELGYYLSTPEPYTITYTFSKIEMLITELDEVIERKVNDTKEYVNSETDEDVKRYYRHQDPVTYFLLNDYQDTFRKSLFISLVSVFEENLIYVIRMLSDYVSIPKKNEDLKGRGNILSQYNLIDKGSKLWTEITDLNTIRNSIVHRGSRLYKERGESYLITKVSNRKIKGLSITNNYLKIEDSSFLKESIVKFSSLFHEIYDNSENLPLK